MTNRFPISLSIDKLEVWTPPSLPESSLQPHQLESSVVKCPLLNELICKLLSLCSSSLLPGYRKPFPPTCFLTTPPSLPLTVQWMYLAILLDAVYLKEQIVLNSAMAEILPFYCLGSTFASQTSPQTWVT